MLYKHVLSGYHYQFGDGDGLRIARVPGRVNIIGEHTDYNGLPVLPTAIGKEIALAFEPSKSCTIKVTNIDDLFGCREFEMSSEIDPYGAGDWGNYIKAAAQALWGWAQRHCPDSLPLRGIRGSVGGTIPPGAGLSSSSAMVVASAVALTVANDLDIQPVELASVLADGEQYVGTRGGGMDQAASLLSKSGHALKVDFNPLRTNHVPVPEDCVFIIANSLIKAEKAGAARFAYNTRVAECRLGVRILRDLLLCDYPELEKTELLGDVLKIIPNRHDLVELLPDQVAGPDSLPLQVKKRCRHVFSEAERVGFAEAALTSGNLELLGELMNQSHESCAHDYEVSCPELDRLVDTLRRHGVLGARLTGAGFGGCAIAVAKRELVQQVLNGTWQDYYAPYAESGVHLTLEGTLFVCRPQGGAELLSLRP